MKNKMPIALGITTFVLSALLLCSSLYLFINTNSPPRSEKDIYYDNLLSVTTAPLTINSVNWLFKLPFNFGKTEKYIITFFNVGSWFLLGYMIGKWFEIIKDKLVVRNQLVTIVISIIILVDLLVNTLIFYIL